MLQATGHPSEIPGILPAISAGYRGTVLVVKGVWLVMHVYDAKSGPHWWEASALTTAPSHRPMFFGSSQRGHRDHLYSFQHFYWCSLHACLQNMFVRCDMPFLGGLSGFMLLLFTMLQQTYSKYLV